MKKQFTDPFSPHARGHYALTLRKQGKSFRDISKELNVCVERARQIIMRAEKESERYRTFAELREFCSSLVKRPEIPAEIRDRSIDDLNLSVRAATCLRNGKINTIGDLISKSRIHIEIIRNMGKKSLFEIENALNELGLGLVDMPIRVSPRRLPFIHPAMRCILEKRGWRETVYREWTFNDDGLTMNWEEAAIAELKRERS